MEKKSFKKTFWRILPIVVLAVLLLLTLAYCGTVAWVVYHAGVTSDSDEYSEEMAAAIKEAFAELPQTTEPIVLRTSKTLCVGDRQTPLKEITYNREEIKQIVCLDAGLYAYTYEEKTPENAKESSNKNLGGTVNVLLVPYDTLTPTCVCTLTVEYDLQSSGYNGGKLFFRVEDPIFIQKGIRDKRKKRPDDYHQLFYLFDVSTGETSVVDSNDVGLDYLTNSRADRNGTDKYAVESVRVSGFKGLFTPDYVKVTELETGKSKKITEEILKDCPEGKSIWDATGGTGQHIAILHFNPVPSCEKDGVVYFTVEVFYGDSSRDPDNYLDYTVVMKYDFETGKAAYHTWYSFDSNQYACDLYIP